jgi:hypothetical protein
VFSAQTQAVNHAEKSLEIAKFGAATPLLPGYEGARFSMGFGHGGQFVANSMVQGWLIEQRSNSPYTCKFEAFSKPGTRLELVTPSLPWKCSTN